MNEKLLVIDDDPSMLEIMGQILQSEGFNIHLVQSADEACSALGLFRYDLVIADAMMGIWDPVLPVVRIVQKAAPGTPIVLFTSYDKASRLDLEAEGLAGVWIKPMDLAELLTSVRAVLQQVHESPDASS
jgi:DNA-binding response OmpR family regulator